MIPEREDNMNQDEIIDITPDCIDNICKSKKLDIEWKFEYFNPYVITIFLILIVVFIAQVYYWLFELGLNKIDLSNFTYKFSNYHKWNVYWIFTSMFLHWSIEHIIWNLTFFYVFALISYRIVWYYKSIWVYIITWLWAGIASYYCNDVPSMWASWTLFGIFWFFTPFFFIYKHKLTDNLLDIAWTFVAMAVILIWSWLAVPYVDNFAHLWWYATGLILGYIYFKSNWFYLDEKRVIINL